jgi:hypothetical protein
MADEITPEHVSMGEETRTSIWIAVIAGRSYLKACNLQRKVFRACWQAC